MAQGDSCPCYVLSSYIISFGPTLLHNAELCLLVGEQKEGRDQHDTHHGVIFRHAHIPHGLKRAATAPGFPYSQCPKAASQDPELLSYCVYPLRLGSASIPEPASVAPQNVISVRSHLSLP